MSVARGAFGDGYLAFAAIDVALSLLAASVLAVITRRKTGLRKSDSVTPIQIDLSAHGGRDDDLERVTPLAGAPCGIEFYLRDNLSHRSVTRAPSFAFCVTAERAIVSQG